MGIFDRMRRGWHLGITSLEVIKDHPKLLLFPVLSGVAVVSVLLSFAGFLGIATGFQPAAMEMLASNLEQMGEVAAFLALFVFYVINFFVIIFFNVGLVYNAKKIFEGGEPSIREGLQFSGTRVGNILAWSVLAATVGTILKVLEDRLGWAGQIVIGLIGFAWTITTYFVVPVLAYENIGPVDALKKSAATIKEKWGESLGAGFSFGLFNILGIFLAFAGGIAVGSLIHPVAGILVGFTTMMLTFIVNAAARNIFLAAAYAHTQGNTPAQFDGTTLDGLFIEKKK